MQLFSQVITINDYLMKVTVQPPSGEGEQSQNSVYNVYLPPFHCLNERQYCTIHLMTAVLSEATGHLLPVLYFTQIPFTHVIVKGNFEVMKKQ